MTASQRRAIVIAEGRREGRAIPLVSLSADRVLLAGRRAGKALSPLAVTEVPRCQGVPGSRVLVPQPVCLASAEPSGPARPACPERLGQTPPFADADETESLTAVEVCHF